MAGPRDDLWKQVDDAFSRGLPRTAIGLLEEIIPLAMEDQAYAEAVKAIAVKIDWEGWIQGDRVEEKIVRFEARMAEAPDPAKPVMEAVLAHWYWQYFQQNRWRFVNRTQTAEPPGEDITTWDLARILAEIDLHFTLALEADQELKAIGIEEYDDLVERGSVPDSYRPTLYDFLAHEALSFYNAGEQAGSESMDAFEIMADSPIFAPVAEFLAWQPGTTDADSAKLKAIQLYQALLTFHKDDSDKTAFIDADLHRLNFGYNHALGPDKPDLYMAALERFADKWSGHEIVSRALHEWAKVAHAEGDFARAHEIAGRGWNTYPDSTGGIWCYNLIQQIEAKSATIKTERVWNDPLPDIEVTYRNVERVFFRAVPFDGEEAIQPAWSYVDDDELTTLLRIQPALEWNADLPATADYQQRTETIAAPEGLEKGFYFIIASHDPSFGGNDNQISVARVWVSDLSLVVRTANGAGSVEGFVLDARDGGPLVGATVTRWTYHSNSRKYLRGAETTSDENGLFSFSYHTGHDRFIIVAEHGGQKLASQNTYRVPQPLNPLQGREGTIFFTDRSLYRPGQTIHYKGICIRTDPRLDDYRTLAGERLTVMFKDTNGQEIASREHLSNDYGSFSGNFTAPRDRLMGRMSLVARGGSAHFNVEEYKRPKFRVQIEAPAEAPRLDAEVTVPGKATAYTGAAIGGAEVSWSVVRQVRFPIWCWWARWIYPAFGVEQIIAHGEAVTEADGSFSIAFTAKPDLTIDAEDEPVFSYRIHADVTDTTGETRSDGHVVRAGYTALEAAIHA
ncbi:MAG: MG2 domain-containing protein, partial [Planctomycetota bacterium]